MDRLTSAYPIFAERLRSVSVARVRAVAVEACNYAFKRNDASDPTVASALEALNRGARISAAQEKTLSELVESLDERYFMACEASSEEVDTPSEYLLLFSQARAVSAISFALRSEFLESNADAIYEASMAIESPEELLDMIEIHLIKAD